METVADKRYLERTRGAALVDVLVRQRAVTTDQQRRLNQATAEATRMRAYHQERVGEDVDEDQMLEAHVVDRHDERQVEDANELSELASGLSRTAGETIARMESGQAKKKAMVFQIRRAAQETLDSTHAFRTLAETAGLQHANEIHEVKLTIATPGVSSLGEVQKVMGDDASEWTVEEVYRRLLGYRQNLRERNEEANEQRKELTRTQISLENAQSEIEKLQGQEVSVATAEAHQDEVDHLKQQVKEAQEKAAFAEGQRREEGEEMERAVSAKSAIEEELREWKEKCNKALHEQELLEEKIRLRDAELKTGSAVGDTITQLRDSLHQRDQLLQERKELLEATKKELAALTDQKSAVDVELSQAQEDEKKASDEAKDWRERMSGVNQDLGNAKLELLTAKSAVNRLQKESQGRYNSLVKARDDLQATQEQSEKRQAELTEKIRELEVVESDRKTEKQTADRRIAELEEKAEKHRQDVETKSEELKTRETARRDLQTDKDTADGRITELKETAKQREQEMKAKQEALDASRSRVQDLEQKIANDASQHQQAIEDLRAESETPKARVSALESEVRTLEEKLGTSEALADKQQKELVGVRGELDLAQSKTQRQDGDLERANGRITTLEKNAIDLRESLAATSGEKKGVLEMAQKQVSDSSVELAKVNGLLKEARGQVTDLTKEKQQLAGDLSAKDGELHASKAREGKISAQAKQQAADKQKQLDAATKQVQQLEGKRDELDQALSSKDEQIKSLDNDLASAFEALQIERTPVDSTVYDVIARFKASQDQLVVTLLSKTVPAWKNQSFDGPRSGRIVKAMMAFNPFYSPDSDSPAQLILPVPDFAMQWVVATEPMRFNGRDLQRERETGPRQLWLKGCFATGARAEVFSSLEQTSHAWSDRVDANNANDAQSGFVLAACRQRYHRADEENSLEPSDRWFLARCVEILIRVRARVTREELQGLQGILEWADSQSQLNQLVSAYTIWLGQVLKQPTEAKSIIEIFLDMPTLDFADVAPTSGGAVERRRLVAMAGGIVVVDLEKRSIASYTEKDIKLEYEGCGDRFVTITARRRVGADLAYLHARFLVKESAEDWVVRNLPECIAACSKVMAARLLED